MTEEVEVKECQLCHRMLPKEQFYKRKDRDGEHTWVVSYCKECEIKKR
jgi:Pyruvate/2-oxoacid:ferredoxin oxidoreductase delta subunit